MCSLGHLQNRGDLRIRRREETRNLFAQGLVGRKPGELALPKVEIAPGQPIEVRRVIVFRGHARTIAHSSVARRSQTQSAPCRSAVSALR